MSCRALDEESLPSYDAEEFYPVHLGDTIKSRYHVIGKLGYGANSTVWSVETFGDHPFTPMLMSCCHLIPLCRNDEYVVVKVYVRTPPGRVNREKAAYEHLANLSTTHPGRHNIR